MASTVCGMTPSSAATTSTTMSVTLAPRARMAVNASWPGVSRKVTRRPCTSDRIGADVLRDAAGLAGGDVGLAHGVEQRRLAVIDVPHDRDHRRARLQMLFADRLMADLDGSFGVEGDVLDVVAELRRRSTSRYPCRALG